MKYKFIRKTLTKINPILSNKLMYYYFFKKKLNLKDPKTFNEKINYLKIYKYPYDDYIINCTDKYKVRDILKRKGLNEYNVKILGVWDNAKDIDWENLPKSFVMKCNHGSKYNIIVKNKENIDKNQTEKKLNKWLKEDFGLKTGELHYNKIHKKIICEEYLGEDLVDFQVWCTNGKILFESYILSPHGLNKKMTFGKKWERLEFVTSEQRLDYVPNKPEKFEEIKSISKKISKGIPFVRVDFYILKSGKIKISELTFSPASGFVQWSPQKYDEIYGKTIHI